MTKSFPCVVALVLAALTVGAPAVAKDKKPVDPNKKVCRSDTSDTGTIMPKRICRTASEWAALDASTGAGSGVGDVRGHGSPRPAGL